MAAWYQCGPGYESQQGRVFFHMKLNIILIYRRFLFRWPYKLKSSYPSKIDSEKWRLSVTFILLNKEGIITWNIF